MSEITNKQRGSWGDRAVLGYCEAKEGKSGFYDEESAVFSDALCDILHAADARGLDVKCVVISALNCYETEVNDED